MSIFGIPYPSDATAHDRKYTSAQKALGYTVLQTSGLSLVNPATDALVAKVTDSMDVSVQPFEAQLAGHQILLDAAANVTLPDGDASNPRIDLIVAESNSNTSVRNPRLTYVQGTPAADPEAPAPSLTASLYQHVLAQVLVPAGATTLNSATITDARTWAYGKHKHNVGDAVGAGEITETMLAATSVTEGKIGTGAVTVNKIGALAVSEAKIATGAVTEGKIGTGAVVEAKIGAGAVTEAKIGTGAVTNTKLGALSVTEAKIATGAVTADKIGSGAVTNAKIGSGAVTGAKIADATVTEAKLESSVQTKLSTDRTRKITISSSSPSGGSDGDVWLKII